MNFELPPVLTNPQGNMRRVGFELEFSGPELRAVAALIADRLGGWIEPRGRFQYAVVGTPYGDFSVESDSNLLKHGTFERPLRALGLDPETSALARKVLRGLAKATRSVFPSELVTPPLPLTQLGIADELREALLKWEAKGTTYSVVSPFGLHLNPEAPALDAATLLAYLRAFLLLYDWIFERSDVDFARRVAPFIRPFPESYMRFVIDPTYRPDVDTLVEDYLDQTPTRNRPLDMLPLFAYLRPERVRSKAHEKDLVKPRPAFHYRLPNSRIDDPSWCIAREWNGWVAVERLAADPPRIRRMCDRFLSMPRADWLPEARRWLPEAA